MPETLRLSDDLVIVPEHIAAVEVLPPIPMRRYGWVVVATLLFGQEVTIGSWHDREDGAEQQARDLAQRVVDAIEAPVGAA